MSNTVYSMILAGRFGGLVVGLMVLSIFSFAQDVVVDSLEPGKNWPSNSPGNAITNAINPSGGPTGNACRVFSYQEGATTFWPFVPSPPLRPGTKLTFWLKGNGTKDCIRLYCSDQKGHRGWDLDLSNKEWKEFTIDLVWNWDREESGRVEGNPSLDISQLKTVFMHVIGKTTSGAGPFSMAHMRFVPAPLSKKPAALFLANWFLGKGLKEISVADELRKAGFSLAAHPYEERGMGRYTFRDELTLFNAVVLLTPLQTDAEGNYDKHTQRLADDLVWFVQQGGGLFFTPGGEYFGNAKQGTKLLSGWGGVEMVDEQIVDKTTQVLSQPFSFPFSYTTNIAASPLTEGVRGIWYMSQTMGPGARCTAPIKFGTEWNILVKAGKGASTVGGKPYQDEPRNTFPSEPPIMGIRDTGQGRIAVVQMNPTVHFVGGLHPAWDGITWNKGVGDRPSDFGKLAVNTLKWLAEPSLKSGVLGGYEEPLIVVEKPAVPEPLDWSKATFPEPPPGRKTFRGLLGAVSSYGGGESTVAEYAAAAGTAGIDFLIFADPFDRMNADSWKKLCDDCKAAGTPSLIVLPGLQYLDKQGNHYLIYGFFSWLAPELAKEILSPDGKRVVDTYKWDAKSEYRTVLLHSLSKNTNRVMELRHYGGIAIQTWADGQCIDDAYKDFLALNECMQYPMPSVVHFVRRAEDVASAVKQGLQLCVWATDQRNLRDYLDQSWANTYFANPHRYYVSSGPRLDDWVELNMNSWRPDAPGTDRWKARLKITGQNPVTQLAVMDGCREYRLFRPRTNAVDRLLAGLHGPQHQLTVRARDSAGGELISSHLKSHTMVHVAFSCSDRQNWLGDGVTAYKQWPANWTAAVNVTDLDKFFPPLWDGTAGGHGGLAVVAVDVKGEPADDENNSYRLATSRRLLFASRDCTMIEQVTDQVFLPDEIYGDCKPTAQVRPSKFLRQRLVTTLYRPYADSDGFVLLEGKVTALKDFELNHPLMHFQSFQMAEKVGPGTLLFVTCPNGYGRQVVHYTPSGMTRIQGGPSGKMCPGDYVARYPRTLGAPAMFALGTNLSFQTWTIGDDNFIVSLAMVLPETRVTKGSEWGFRSLGVASMAPLNEGNRRFETIRQGFALDGGNPAYTVTLERGAVLSRQYELRLKAEGGYVLAGVSKTDLPAPLPVVVEGLAGHLPAVLYDRETKELRRFVVFENRGYVCLELGKARSVFLGSPVTVSSSELIVDAVDYNANSLTFEIHNPTEKPIKAEIKLNEGMAFGSQTVKSAEIPPGESVQMMFGQ